MGAEAGTAEAATTEARGAEAGDAEAGTAEALRRSDRPRPLAESLPSAWGDRTRGAGSACCMLIRGNCPERRGEAGRSEPPPALSPSLPPSLPAAPPAVAAAAFPPRPP